MYIRLLFDPVGKLQSNNPVVEQFPVCKLQSNRPLVEQFPVCRLQSNKPDVEHDIVDDKSVLFLWKCCAQQLLHALLLSVFPEDERFIIWFESLDDISLVGG